MMQEEDTTTSAVAPVMSVGVPDEKKEETPAEAAFTTALGSSEPSIADRLDKTKEIMKDFGKTVAIEKPKQMFADIQDMASNFKEKVEHKLSPNNNNGETTNGEPTEKVDPMEKPRQFFNDMKEKATSFKGFSLNPPAGATTATARGTPEDLDVTSNEATPTAADGPPKNDALERSKEFFEGMKEKATSFKIKIGEEKLDEDGNPVPGPLDRMKADMKGLASGIREKMPLGEEKLDEDGNPVPGPLDRMKADMKDWTSGIREKMPLGEEKLDEDGNPVPGPLDRMKADMKDWTSGIREKMATTTTNASSSRGATGTTSTEGDSAVFTISEEDDEEGAARISAEQPPKHDLSLKFNDLVQSARTTANDSLTSMPSLRSFYNTNSDKSSSSFPKFGEKFSAFRHSTIDPISEKLRMKKEESSEGVDAGGVEEISFGAEPTIVELPPPPATETESTSVTVSQDYV